MTAVAAAEAAAVVTAAAVMGSRFDEVGQALMQRAGTKVVKHLSPTGWIVVDFDRGSQSTITARRAFGYLSSIEGYVLNKLYPI